MSCTDLTQEDMEWDGREADGEKGEVFERATGTESEGKSVPVVKRLGLVSKSRLRSQAGDIRLNWKRKLVKPRMGMVADLEERALGKKTPVLTISRNPSSYENFFNDFSRKSVEPLTRTVVHDVSPEMTDLDEDSSSDVEVSDRTFHFVKGSQMECNDSLEADCGQDLEMTNSNIIIKISRGEEEEGSQPELINNNEHEKIVDEDQEEGLNVINKIAAIKEIDRKLETIEGKNRRLNEGWEPRKEKVRSPERRRKQLNTRRRRRERSWSSSSCSSSSSETCSDSSSDSDDEAGKAGNKARGRKRVEIDLKEKLKHYLNRAKKRRSGKS